MEKKYGYHKNDSSYLKFSPQGKKYQLTLNFYVFSQYRAQFSVCERTAEPERRKQQNRAR
jgi:hypothetical protein